MTPFLVKILIFALILFRFEEGTSSKGSLPKSFLKISKGGKDYIAQVSVNVKKGSESFHLREFSSGREVGDVIYDFKRSLTMTRVPDANACFLSKLFSNIPKPADLLQLLKWVAAMKVTPLYDVKLKVVGTIKDHSGLSREMVKVCGKLPVYRVTTQGTKIERREIMVKRNSTGGGLGQKVCYWICEIICKLVCWLLG